MAHRDQRPAVPRTAHAAGAPDDATHVGAVLQTDMDATATDMLTTVRVNGCELRIWEPDTGQGDLGRMYVLDALGLTLMVREREDGTFVHVDDDGDTASFRGPLMVEVRNGGEETYGEPATETPDAEVDAGLLDDPSSPAMREGEE